MKHPAPKIGLRIVKSAAAVCICLLVSMLTQREGMRIYASIAALWCIRPYVSDTKKMALQRINGTAIGAVYGALVIFLEVDLFQIRGALPGYLLIAAMIVPILWTAVSLGLDNAAYFSCVVFLSITVTHITDANPWLFVWNRVMETLAGIAVGVCVNAAHLPRRRRRDVLFVSGLDGMLLDIRDRMTPYSKFCLNRMLDDGALITLSTLRTPASVREATAGLRFRLPIIVMDGAAVYDLDKKTFLHTVTLPEPLVEAAESVFTRHGVHCFLNGLMNDTVMIFFGELKNDAERDVYQKLRTSPYRNYVDRRYYSHCPILYLMGLDRTEKVQSLYDELFASGLAEQVKILFYPSVDYPGYSYLKIYEKSASRPAMLEQLKRDLGVERAVVFTSRDGCGDIVMHETDSNRVVRALEGLYRPLLWSRGGDLPG